MVLRRRMSKGQYLTKSRFKIGCECPTKLFYNDDKSYDNRKIDNSFLKALAEGGFQVGELTKLYNPRGTEITTEDKDLAAQQTADLLKNENIIIYEASFKFENLFVKTDLVIKKGEFVELIEVKSKSIDTADQNPFFKKDGKTLNKDFESYILDIAFQTYVFKKAFPKLKYTSHLMLADKKSQASVDGLNQMFSLQRDGKGKTSVKVRSGISKEELGKSLLTKINVDEPVKSAWDMKFEKNKSFESFVSFLSNITKNKIFEKPKLGAKCGKCEFLVKDDDGQKSLKSGFKECWNKAVGLKDQDFDKDFVFDLWFFLKKEEFVTEGKYFIDQLSIEDINPKENEKGNGLSRTQRQWLQVEKVQKKDHTAYINHQHLKSKFQSWTYPLHFIDFETTRVAIPFNKGRRPYEQIAFQFSHHQVNENGEIVHQDEYINMDKGKFPNFDFVRALMNSLKHDDGTIFRYAPYENTVLCEIRAQLQKSEEPDRKELINFIESITKPSKDSTEKWVGRREMVDLLELVKQYYYHPMTKGSNSIKAVLPAVLNGSEFLQKKYSIPIYGTDRGIFSKNFKNKCWIEKKDGAVINPYNLLPPLFSDLDLETMDSLITEDSIADGGAAMTAYARMQFMEMSAAETARVANALLQYCELDTFAMVMIYEHWKNEIYG
jgi:hypothetical protein